MKTMKILSDFGALNSAEQRLLDGCIKGNNVEISSTRPEKPISEGEKANTVRATLIRWLALGGDTEYPIHDHGIRLKGAWIKDELDLDGATVNKDLYLMFCHLEQNLFAIGTQFKSTLSLGGSFLAKGLTLDRAQIVGSLLLRADKTTRFQSLGAIRLLGTKIGGDLSCRGARIEVQDSSYALSADQAEILGSVYLRCTDSAYFESFGEVRFIGSNIGGNLECDGAKLTAHINQYALNADSMQVAGSVFLREKFESVGGTILLAANIKSGLVLTGLEKPIEAIDVSHATVGFLETDLSAWGKDIQLDGFKYGALRNAGWLENDYLAWLKRQSHPHFGTKLESKNFKPQPWQQLINVLRKMGHNDEARDIAVAFEQRRFEIGKVRGLAKPLHWVFGKLAGYGYKPLRLVNVMIAIWLSFGLCFWLAAYQGVFTPSDPLVFQNSTYDTCRSVDKDGKPRIINNLEPNQVTYNWYTCGKLMGEYTTFSPLTYSLDVILPLVDLGQEKTWGTYIDTAKPNAIYELMAFTPNHIVRLMVWFEILFGWMASLMLVAVLTGLTDRNKS